MKFAKLYRWMALVAVVAGCAQIAAGQTTGTASASPPGYDGARESMDGAHIPPIPGNSFSARVELETTNTLADGSTVTHHTFNLIARDFRGRTHNEFRQWNNPTTGADGKLTYALLYDPDTRTRTYLYPSAKLAREYVYPPPSGTKSVSAKNPLASTLEREDLGTKFSEDLQLTGTRETKTYAAGAVGNSQPLSIVTEYWYSPDLRVNISVKRTDPRYGVQTVEVTNVQRGEPDAAMFEVPPDYKVVNETGNATATSTAPTSTLTNDAASGAAGVLDRVRMGGNAIAAKLVNRVQPEYPELARQSRISGTVRMHAIIGKDGKVQSLTLVSGHPLLVKAAIDAVSQWRYEPTMLNGSPVEVDTTIDVLFALS
jgi:TonB family protein